MAFDALSLRAVTAELQARLVPSRINKIYQPTPTELVLLLHGQGKNYKLLLSAHAQNARVHLTEFNRENPPAPPVFCMLLRKHLEGGMITAINQPDLERMFTLSVAGEDEIGLPTTKVLIAELMGKHSNLILVNQENGLIIDSLKRIPPSLSRVRQVLPGRPYQLPPGQGRANPLHLSEDGFAAALTPGEPGGKLWKHILNSLAGLSPLMAREIVRRAGFDPETETGTMEPGHWPRLTAALTGFFASVRANRFVPTLIQASPGGNNTAFAAFDLSLYPDEQKTTFPTMNRLLDTLYQASGTADRLEQTRQSLLRLVGAELARCRKKLAIQTEAWEQAGQADELRAAGDLILANLHAIRKGDPVLLATDYADPEQRTRTIALNPQLTPAENAQSYFRRYAKAKNSLGILAGQRNANTAEINYLETCENNLEQAAALSDLAEIRQELVEEGYLKPLSAGRRGQAPPKPSAPFTFRSPDGYTILAGRNNKQNDWLTRSAAPEDLWLHTKDIPGAHVLIRTRAGEPVPDSTLLAAASIAAYYSKAHGAATVPVDYTLVRYVRKPRGARPGLVIYDHQRTLMAIPNPGQLVQT